MGDKIILIEVDGRSVTIDEFNSLQSDPNFKLVKLAENKYKTLQRMLG